MTKKDFTHRKGETLSPVKVERLTASPAPSRVCLLVLRGSLAGQQHELEGKNRFVIGRSLETDIPIDDQAVSRLHARIDTVENGFVISDTDSSNGLFVNGLRVKRHVLHDGDVVQIGSTVLRFAFANQENRDLQRRALEAVTRDALTGAYNRRVFEQALEADFSCPARDGEVMLSLLLIELDQFQSVSERHGRAASDVVLRTIVGIVQSRLRPEDLLSRSSGHRFAAVLRFTDSSTAMRIAGRIRDALETTDVENGNQKIRITASMGLATLVAGAFAGPGELVAAAIAALEQAQSAGGNRVFASAVASSTAPKTRAADHRGAASAGTAKIDIRSLRVDPHSK